MTVYVECICGKKFHVDRAQVQKFDCEGCGRGLVVPSPQLEAQLNRIRERMKQGEPGMREAMSQGSSVTEAYFVALKTTGIAIFYTALTLAVGVAMWIFSELKFQADMGLMLTFMFVVNMFAALIFLPALCRWLLRPFEKDTFKPKV